MKQRSSGWGGLAIALGALAIDDGSTLQPGTLVYPHDYRLGTHNGRLGVLDAEANLILPAGRHVEIGGTTLIWGV